MSKIRVLLVDEDKELISTVAERLRMRGMEVQVSSNGESVLQMICDMEPEVMVLDLRVTGIDGMELLRRVTESRPGLQTIVISWYASWKDRETALGLGAIRYFQKPVDIDELTQALIFAHGKSTEIVTG